MPPGIGGAATCCSRKRCAREPRCVSADLAGAALHGVQILTSDSPVRAVAPDAFPAPAPRRDLEHENFVCNVALLAIRSLYRCRFCEDRQRPS